jgi:diguanylate cyclase (GGDEF)-like protein
MTLQYKNKEEVYLRGLNGGNIAVWEWNLKNEELFLSNNIENVIDRKVSKYKSLYEFIHAIVIEEDRANLKEEMDYIFKSDIASFNSEFRIISKNRNIIWLRLKGNVIRNFEDEIILISGSIRDVTEKKLLRDKIVHLSYYDHLTGLPNRVMFTNDIKTEIEKWKYDGQKGALIYVDIDNFKLINDAYGQDYGDLILITFSQLLKAIVKPFAKAYRLSSDEFILLVNNADKVNNLNEICREIIEFCKNPFELKNKQIYITISVGISRFPEDTLNEFELYKYADLAMQHSKIKGKNNITYFQKVMADDYFRKLLIEQELKSAIEKDELFVVYQPQIDCINNKIIGFEALLRWKNSRLGFVSPSEFIPIAESSGMIVKIGEWLTERVCHSISDFLLKGISFERVSINVSTIELKQKGFLSRLLSACNRNNINPSLVEIEITESTLMDIHSYQLEILKNAIDSGFRIAVDDFGIGYSSLTYLSALPIKTVKLDKYFVDNIEDNSSRAVIKCIVDLCKALEYDIVAEGVESIEQVELIKDYGCNIIQGYYYSKPLPESELEVFEIGL